MSNEDVGNLIGVSEATVRRSRHLVGFDYLSPIDTFILTPLHISKRLAFCQQHQNDNWADVIFTDENSFYLDNDHRWLWRRRGKGDDHTIQHIRVKYTKKVMVFGGISRNWTTPLVAKEGNIDADIYVDECIDGSGLIAGMNSAYGVKWWTLMQDGAPCHTASNTIDYLSLYCNVLKDWPHGSPDLNPIENLWAIMKKRVEEQEPGTVEELIQVAFDTWEALDVNLIHRLMDSVNGRVKECLQNQGGRTSH